MAVKRKYEVHEVPDDERTPREVIKLMAPSTAKKRVKSARAGFEREEVKDDRPRASFR